MVRRVRISDTQITIAGNAKHIATIALGVFLFEAPYSGMKLVGTVLLDSLKQE